MCLQRQCTNWFLHLEDFIRAMCSVLQSLNQLLSSFKMALLSTYIRVLISLWLPDFTYFYSNSTFNALKRFFFVYIRPKCRNCSLIIKVCCRSEVKRVQNNRHYTTEEFWGLMKYFFLKGNFAKRNIMDVCYIRW